MLSATEFYPVTLALQIVLWIEAFLYLGIGIYELFDDFFEKPQPWMTINGRVNGYLRLTHKIGHKMHAGICVLLGFVALNLWGIFVYVRYTRVQLFKPFTYATLREHCIDGSIRLDNSDLLKPPLDSE